MGPGYYSVCNQYKTSNDNFTHLKCDPKFLDARLLIFASFHQVCYQAKCEEFSTLLIQGAFEFTLVSGSVSTIVHLCCLRLNFSIILLSSYLPTAADSEEPRRARLQDCWLHTAGWSDAPTPVAD